jgi:predicted extracellular nuclease
MILVGQNFKIASYNVQNLFDLERNGGEYHKYIPYQNGWNREALNNKLNNISTVICDINADIIALQEIENLNALKLLQKRLKRVGCEYKYSAIANRVKSTVKTAILSRYKISNSNEIKIGTSIKKRSILEVTIDINNIPLTIFVNHWKSKYHGGKESKRIA